MRAHWLCGFRWFGVLFAGYQSALPFVSDSMLSTSASCSMDTDRAQLDALEGREPLGTIIVLFRRIRQSLPHPFDPISLITDF
jgi:hypothetical protein